MPYKRSMKRRNAFRRKQYQNLRFKTEETFGPGIKTFTLKSICGSGTPLFTDFERPCRIKYILLKMGAAIPCAVTVSAYDNTIPPPSPSRLMETTINRIVGTSESTIFLRIPRYTDFGLYTGPEESVFQVQTSGPLVCSVNVCWEFDDQPNPLAA